MSVRVHVEELWQRDALRLVAVDHDAHTASLVDDGYQGAPMLRMIPTDPEAPVGVAEADRYGIVVPESLARHLYAALREHYGDTREPGSRELVDTLSASLGVESARVDKMLDALLDGHHIHE